MMTKNTTNSATKFARVLSYSVAVAAILSIMPNPSRAAPVGGVVASGSASISASGLVTTINQTSDRAVIDWQSFNLSHNEIAHFNVPSDSSATLNRISGGVSTISGSVESNGTVYFANPNGLVFDATSRVTANGFVATTGTISNFDFMNRGEFSNHHANQVTLNGAISASAITVQSGTVTVGGNLAAGSGKILLSSSSLTTIGQGATIRADGGLNSSGGNIKIWSDTHTDFLGSITALGGTNCLAADCAAVPAGATGGGGDGGFVEVSGKATLNFSGTVSTLAAHGKTGTLLLDPATIEIVAAAGTTAGVSYILTSTLVTALGTSNVTIDANTPSTTGFATPPTLLAGGTGLITVIDPVVASGTFNLTLTGSQIIINNTLTVGGILTLVATKASVWQNPGKVITAATLTGSSVDGFALGGANRITNLGAVTNSGTAGILVKNDKALSITASTIDGGRGGVMILAPNYDITLAGAVTVLGSYLRLDMGSTGHLVSPSGASNTLTASGLDVYYTSATASSNNATIEVGRGSFTFVNDKRTVTTAKILNNSSTATDWGAAPTYGNSGGNPTLGGLTITGTGTLNGLGVVYGGTVNIQGIDTGAAKDLRYIEGVGVGVTIPTGLTPSTGGSTFSGSLILVSSGLYTFGANDNGGIVMKASLTTNNGGNLTLIQTGIPSANGLTIKADQAAEMTVGGHLTMNQFGIGNIGIAIEAYSLSVKGNIVMTQVGTASYGGLSFNGATLNSGKSMILTQSGTALTGLLIDGSSFSASKDLSLMQSGRLTGVGTGVYLTNLNRFTIGSTSAQLTITTNNRPFSLGDYSNFTIAGGGRVMIDIGTATMGSVNFIAPQTVYTLNAPGSAVYFKGASSGNNANIAVGSGSFTYIADRSSLTGTVPISNGSTLNDLFLIGVGYGGTTPGTRTIAGLTITGASDTAISGIGVKYGGAVTINGVTPGSVAGSLRYIEANSIQTLTAASNFSGSLILVTSGGTAGYGVKFDTNLTVGTVNDRVSNLTILQYNPIEYDGILISSSIVVTAGGSITMVQAGASNNLNGIATRGQSSIAAGGDLSLTSTGTSFQGSMVLFNTTLDANGDITLTQAATANTVQSGISLSNVKLAARGNISLNQLGNTGTGLGIELSASTTALSDRVELNAGFGKSISLSAKNGIALKTANNFKLTGGSRVVVNLGTSVITSSSGTYTLNAAGMDVLYSGPLSGNNATIAVGGGSFTFVSDQSTVTDSTTIGSTTTLATLGLGSVSYAGVSGARTLAGLTITGSSDAAIKGIGVRYGGTVIINGVTTASAAGGLNYFEGTTITTTPTASSFSGSLTLTTSSNSTGNGIVVNCNLTVGTSGDGGSKLVIRSSSSSNINGITFYFNVTEVSATGSIILQHTGDGRKGIFNQSSMTLTSGGSIDLISSGNLQLGSIALTGMKMTAAGDITISQSGTSGTVEGGIELTASTAAAADRLSFTAGAGKTVSLTAQTGMTLRTADNFAVLGGSRLEINLGGSTIRSLNAAGALIAGSGFTLNAAGMAVFFSGGSSGNNATIAAGSGSFTFVGRPTGTGTLAIDSTTTLVQLGLAGLSYGGVANLRTIGGLQVTGSDDAAIQGFGVKYSEAVTITGLASGEAQKLSYIQAIGLTLSGTNRFDRKLWLQASGTSPLSLGGSLTTGGKLDIVASGLSLSSDFATSGGAVSINLGSSGIYNNGTGAGYTLSTSGQNLAITAGSLSNTTPTNAIFRLGDTARLTLSGGLALATVGSSTKTTVYHSTFVTTDAEDAKFYAADAEYYFVSDVAAAKTAKSSDARAVILSVSAVGLETNDLGYKTVSGLTTTYSSGGLAERNSGDFYWGDSTHPYSDPTSRNVTYRLKEGHRVVFYKLTPTASATVVATPSFSPQFSNWLAKSSALYFEGANSFNGDLTVASQGLISQETNNSTIIIVTGGSFNVTGSGSIELNHLNSFGTIGNITSTGGFLINNHAPLTITGRMSGSGTMSITTSGVGSNITLSGAVSSSGGAFGLTSSGTITQSEGSTLEVSSGYLSVSAATGVTLTNRGNRITRLTASTQSSSIQLTNDSHLTLIGNLTLGQAGGAILITVNNDAGLTLGANVTSNRGPMVLNLGTGVYDAISVYVPPTGSMDTNGYKWTTTGQNLTLIAGSIKAGTGAVFELGAGVLTHTIASFSTQPFGTNLYFSNDRSITANNIKDITNDPTAEYHSLDDLNAGLVAGGVFKDTTTSAVSNTGTLRLESNRVFAADNPGTIVTFWNVRYGVVNARLNVKEIRFGGAQNSFSEFKHKVDTGPERAAMTILAGSVLRGDIAIGSAGLTFQPGARAVGGRIWASTPGNVSFTILNFVGDFVQQPGDSFFVPGDPPTVKITSDGYSVRLLNRGNAFNRLDVATGGGNFQIASNSPLNFSALNSGGGSVVLDTTGKIEASGVLAGSVSFRAGGSVVLNGFFASASGTGSSVSLMNSAAGFVLGGISASSSVSVAGSGSAILEGDVIGSGAVSFDSAVTVARDSTVAASGGRIDFAKTVAALNAAVGLRLDAGYGGVISLGGSLGSASLSLGWVDLTGTVNNPAGSIFARDRSYRNPGM